VYFKHFNNTNNKKNNKIQFQKTVSRIKQNTTQHKSTSSPQERYPPDESINRTKHLNSVATPQNVTDG